MTDKLLFAKSSLLKEGYTLTLYDGSALVVSFDRGVKPLLDLYKEGENYSAFSAADKVIGKAAAFLYVLLGVREIWAKTASLAAIKILREHGIEISCDNSVPYIINRAGDGMCPMESALEDISSPEQALSAIEKRLEELKK